MFNAGCRENGKTGPCWLPYIGFVFYSDCTENGKQGWQVTRRPLVLSSKTKLVNDSILRSARERLQESREGFCRNLTECPLVQYFMYLLAFFLFLFLPFPHFSQLCVAPAAMLSSIILLCVCVFTVVSVTVVCCWCFPFHVGWVPFFLL